MNLYLVLTIHYDVGNIYLNVIEDGFPACTVYLSVTGKEKCEWTETTTTTEPD